MLISAEEKTQAAQRDCKINSKDQNLVCFEAGRGLGGDPWTS